MNIFPYTDVDEAAVIQDSIELASLTVELRDLLDELDIPRLERDRLDELIRDRDRELGRLAYIFGVRAGDLHAQLLGKIRRRDEAGANEEGAGG